MKKVLISGSSSGIGKAIAEKALHTNHAVVGLARSHEKFNPDDKNYHTYSIDFSKTNDIEHNLKSIHKQHSDINTIICCAGFGHFHELEQFSFAKMQEIMNVNFLSQAILIKTFLPDLKKQDNSKVIILGSECALEGQKKASMYCASKFALRGFAQSLRKECASAGVAVTIINPGLVETPFYDDLQFKPGDAHDNAIQPEQIANTIAMLIDLDNNCVFEELALQPMKKVVQRKSET